MQKKIIMTNEKDIVIEESAFIRKLKMFLKVIVLEIMLAIVIFIVIQFFK